MIDPGAGWHTERLALDPLQPEDADEMFALLDDQELHEFIGGSPFSRPELVARYERLARRRSPDGSQVWGNWVVREGAVGQAVGTVQATLPAAGPGSGPAEVAWVVGRAFQGRGFATEAAASLVVRLRDDGWRVVAHVHPDHVASRAVARRSGLEPTDEMVDGETTYASP